MPTIIYVKKPVEHWSIVMYSSCLVKMWKPQWSWGLVEKSTFKMYSEMNKTYLTRVHSALPHCTSGTTRCNDNHWIPIVREKVLKSPIFRLLFILNLYFSEVLIVNIHLLRFPMLRGWGQFGGHIYTDRNYILFNSWKKGVLIMLVHCCVSE